MTDSGAQRVGIGYDIHRLGGGRPLLIGGVAVPYPQGPVGHSDGDVLLHAVIDALLGAAGLGDIGSHFPPQDERWRGADSRDLLVRTLAIVGKAGYEVGNIDATVVLERPRLAGYMEAIREGIARDAGIEAGSVNVKAKSNEGLNAVGEGRAIAAHAVVLLRRRQG